MVCAECQDLLSEFVDGSLPERRRESVQGHLRSCPRCRALCDDLAQIIEASSRLPLHTPSGLLWTRIEREIRSTVTQSWWARLGAQRLDISISARQALAAAALC